MRAFRFRAVHVLDLRRRQHEAAETQLARAQQERDAAERVLRAADEAAELAAGGLRGCLGSAHTAEAVERHRNWIALKEAERADRQRWLEERQLGVSRATRVVQETFMRLRALERLRDRSLHKYQHEVRRLDAIDMDQLAVLQHARKTGGLNGDD